MDRINQLTHSVLDDIDNCSDLKSIENLRVNILVKMESLLQNLNLYHHLKKMKRKK